MPVSCLVLFVEMNGGPFGWLTMLTEREKTTLLTRFYTLSLLTVVVVLVIILRLLLLMLLLLLLFMPALFEALLFFLPILQQIVQSCNEYIMEIFYHEWTINQR